MAKRGMWLLGVLGATACVVAGCGDDTGGSGSGTGGGAASEGVGGSAEGGAGPGSGGDTEGGAGPVEPALDCTDIESNIGDRIACNGACIRDVGETAAGCRVLLRSYTMEDVLVVDGDALFVSDIPITRQEGIDMEYGGAARIAVVDRPSATVTAQVVLEQGTPYIRSVNQDWIAFFVNEGTAGYSLRVAPRGTGDITDNTVLVDAVSFGIAGYHDEQIWFSGDTLFFQFDRVWDYGLMSVPVGGGETTRYEGFIRDVVALGEPVLYFGTATDFAEAVQLFQVSADGSAATAVGNVLIDGSPSSAVLVEGSSIYYLWSTAEEWHLERTDSTGANHEALGTFAWQRIIGRGPEGFLGYDDRYVNLLPVGGGAAQRLVDLGTSHGALAAYLTPTHVIVVADGHGTTSHYLLEVQRP